MRTISESDWKRFRVLHTVSLARFHSQALAKIRVILETPSECDRNRFESLTRLIDRQNRVRGDLFDDLRRSTAFLQLARIRAAGLVNDEELARFDDATRSALVLIGAV